MFGYPPIRVSFQFGTSLVFSESFQYPVRSQPRAPLNYLNIAFGRKLVPSGTSDVRQSSYGRRFSPVTLEIFKIVVMYKTMTCMCNNTLCIVMPNILFKTEHVQI